jgi:hypothetical protein
MTRLKAPPAAWVLNGALRIAIVGFATEAVLAGNDPRFAGKGIAIRDVILAGTAATLLIPAWHAFGRRGHRYPVWADSLVLSIMALDMAGNSFNLYAQDWRFDLIPHAYGPGVSVVALKLVGVAWVPGTLIVNASHLLLELQEAAGDLLFDTHNVRGWWDTLTDLAAGAAASLGIPLLWGRLRSVGDRSPIRTCGAPSLEKATSRHPVSHRAT